MSIDFDGIDKTKPHPRVLGAFLPVRLEDEDHLNLNNANGAALLVLLELPNESMGQVEVAEARRAIMRARASFDRRAPALERPETRLAGAPRVQVDGTVELRPMRLWSPAFTSQDLRERLERFARTVEALAARGATHIQWG